MTTTALSGALAITGVALFSGAANAAVTSAFNGSTTLTFATQAASASSGAISLTTSQGLILSFAAADSCPTNATITLTAPAGVTFTAAPGITAHTGTATATGFVSGASTVTYTVGTAIATAGTNTVTIGGTAGIFTLASGTTFTSPVTTDRVFSGSLSGCSNGTTTLSTIGTVANGFRSASAIQYDAAAPGANITVDTGATGQGKLFSGSSSRVATGGTATYTTASTLINTAGGTTYSAASSSGVLAVSGIFTQMARVYLSSSTCVSTAGGSLPSGSLTGTVSGSTATFSGLVSGVGYTLCFENNGSSVIQTGSYSGSMTATAITGTTANTTGLGTLVYSGTGGTINYVTGGSAYQYFARVTNSSSSAVSVFVVVTKDDGSTPLSGLITTNLGANANALYSVTDINTASGANLTASDRARVQVLTSTSSATVQGILFNTATGVITVAQ